MTKEARLEIEWRELHDSSSSQRRCGAATRSASSRRPDRWTASASIGRSSAFAQRGFRTKTYGDIYRSHGYLAGDDATRADELMAAFADPETSAVWCARGGYGVVRLLDRIDFDVIRRQPKGFHRLQRHHGRCTSRFSSAPAWSRFTARICRMASANRTTCRPRTKRRCGGRCWPTSNPTTELAIRVRLCRHGASRICEPITPAVATGRLTGGNLAVICGLMGTPFEIETAGRILFLEDVSERLYRIDRYLAQLRSPANCDRRPAFLLGSFSYDDDEPAESRDRGRRACSTSICGGLGIPVLAGFPAGHAQYNLTLPMGALDRNRCRQPPREAA